MPLDARPNQSGNVAIEDRGLGRLISNTFSGTSLASVRLRGTPTLYMPHHATCPDAEKWRR
jgi:cytochrome oxidase Cu insertion factor (SCO1/SenC/PrrC family)